VKRAPSPPAIPAAAARAATPRSITSRPWSRSSASTATACSRNASFENVLGLSRRSVQRGSVFDWFVDSQRLQDTVAAVCRNDFATSRLEALLRRPGALHGEPLPVHVIVNQMDASRHVVVELVEIEQQNGAMGTMIQGIN